MHSGSNCWCCWSLTSAIHEGSDQRSIYICKEEEEEDPTEIHMKKSTRIS
jgi:hypothetical protein